MKLRVGDALWCRIVDVGAALGGRAYAAGEPIVFELADTFLPENAGRWRLADGEATRTEAAPDLGLNVTELGSVYLGGFTFAELRRAGLVQELAPGAVERADAVFRTDVRPWCPEIF
jgi:predicted acetyltransferase